MVDTNAITENVSAPKRQMTILALLGGYGLKGGDTLFNFSALALWTPEPLLFVLRDFQS